MISYSLIQKVVLSIVVILFIASMGYAGRAGLRAAQSNAVLKNVAQLQVALDFFLKDQTRYPSAQEFTTISAFGQYLNTWPVPDFPGNLCPQSFSYRQTSLKHYELSFCLPASAQGLAEGFHTVTK
jgi:hypothetical protein